MKRIVYNLFDGGVSICCPADETIAWMGCGGFWADRPRGFLETQIERQIAEGVSADVAARYAMAMQFGGCTTAEALEIIRDRDCAPYGTAIELWDVVDVPADRWFRDAWRRSQNGGPISVDLRLAKSIQFTRARGAVASENKLRADRLAWEPKIEVDWMAIRRQCVATSSIEELCTIWPRELIDAGL